MRLRCLRLTVSNRGRVAAGGLPGLLLVLMLLAVPGAPVLAVEG